MFRFNIPLTKVDEEKRLVYGLITEQIVDQAGEILDYDTSKAYFEEWSAGISKATNGASLGNLRLMHQPVIAGKLIEINFDDVLKQISCVAKIVDDNVWNLVLEGCLTGFSMGGKYVKRWKDAANKAISWFTAKPVEVSVVDNPCVTTATFEYIKSDGSIELRKFHSAGDGEGEVQMFTQEQIAAKAAELAKAAGTPDAAAEFMDEALVQLEGEDAAQKAAAAATAAEGDGEEGEEEEDGDEKKPKADKTVTAEEREELLKTAAEELVQVWQTPDGRTFSKKADGAAAIVDGPAPEPEPAPAVEETAVEKALRLAKAATEAPAGDGTLAAILEDLDKAAEAYTAAEEHVLPLVKGMYDVRSLSSVITDLRYVISSLACDQSSPTPSPVPAALMGALRTLASSLVTLTENEVACMIASLGTNYPSILGTVENSVVAEFTKDDSSIMQKVGARNSAADKARIQVTHDSSVLLGATCNCDADKTVIADEVLEETPLVKGLHTTIENQATEITKAVEGIAALGATIAEMQGQIEKFGKSPQALPPRTDHVVLERFGKSETITPEALQKMSPDQLLDLSVRISQMNPQHVGGQ